MKLFTLHLSLFTFLCGLAAQAANIAITPQVRHFDTSGGRAAIVTSGSGAWTASVSAGWIHLEHTDYTEAGYPVPYSVDANNGVEARTGTILVSGNTHTITQDGIGARLGANLAEFAQSGGAGSVTVYAPAGNSWHAKSNVDWITVDAATGSGTAAVTFRVARYDEISTRSGTLTIADQTFTVRQVGRPMALTAYAVSTDYFAEMVKLRVNALADTEWAVVSHADWITVVDAGRGLGGDALSLRVAENASYQRREGTVTIGTETLTVTQLGRTSLVFRLDRSEFTTGADGATGERAAVTATQDLGWNAAADASWIEFYPGYVSGSGNGSIAYRVSPNPTLYPRSGTITVTAVDASVAPKRIEVSQEAAVATLTMDGYAFEAGGETVSVGVATGPIVGWTIINTNGWLTIAGQPASGPAELRITAAANSTVYPRSGVVRIADHDFTVTQKGRGVTVDYEAKLFDTDGKTAGSAGENVIRVTAESDVAWIAEADDPTWIIIYSGASGTGNGTVKYMVAPYVGDGTIRRGTIRIGDREVTISQRPYAASISPKADWVDGNAGAGEIQVSLDIDAVWDVVLTDKSQGWLEVTVLSRDSSTGRGKVAIKYADNNTGKPRSAVILIAGEEYTLTQAARQTVSMLTAVDGHGGQVVGGGTYDRGAEVVLAAVPDAGYVFTGWSGASTATEPTLAVVASASATYTATFAPAKPALAVAEACLAGVTLVWTDIPWATAYQIFRGASPSSAAATQIAVAVNDGTVTYLDETGVENQAYWYWVKAVGAEDEAMSDGVTARRAKRSFAIAYANLRGAAHDNRTSYTEGESYTPDPPAARRGYTFAGWTPGAISPSTSGDVTFRANWRQNTYTVRYETDGAAEIPSEAMTYGFYRDLTDVVPARIGYDFLGWQVDGAPLVAPEFKNLTVEPGGVATISAVWKRLITETQTTDVPVPHVWLNRHFPGTADYEAKALATAANGRKVWECYVAGLVPTDPANDLKVEVEIKDGEVCVSWTPDLNTNGVVARIYTLYGRTDLGKGDWESPVQPWHRFFKVAVAMPTGAVGEKTAVSGEGFVPEEWVGVQLWENGPYWAECNVGAMKPEEYGYYFWWGDTVGYVRNAGNTGWVASDGSGKTHAFLDGNTPTSNKTFDQLKSMGYVNDSGNLTAEHDAATQHWGTGWRMPMYAEQIAFVNNCDWTWTTQNGVNGYVVKGRGAFAGNSIFVPASGYGYGSGFHYSGSYGYSWSSLLNSGDDNGAWNSYFDSVNVHRGYSSCSLGFTVRAVRESAK